MSTRRLQVYESPEITVTFDPNVCIHSGVCVRGLPLVFDVHRKRWIRPELAAPGAVAAQIARCPSGALQFHLAQRGKDDGTVEFQLPPARHVPKATT